MSAPFVVLLYYKYVPLSEPAELVKEQKELCKELNLKGRIIISAEGINGTLAGTPEAVAAYQAATESVPGLADIEWKTSEAEEQVFPRWNVKLRDEIVTLGVRKTGVDVSLSNAAHYIEPNELVELYDSETDFVILDARNAYEATLGKFKNALVPPIDSFREFPEFVNTKLSEYKNKPVVTYCTGGVRCEKASAYLREQGFTDVRQLHGGVHVYAEKTGGKYFEGELFVFDKRLRLKVNTVNPSVISHCLYCNTPTPRLVDCQEYSCGELIVCCESCEQQHSSCCSSECEDKHRSAAAL